MGLIASRLASFASYPQANFYAAQLQKSASVARAPLTTSLSQSKTSAAGSDLATSRSGDHLVYRNIYLRCPLISGQRTYSAATAIAPTRSTVAPAAVIEYTGTRRPLVILMPWIFAREKHVEKFRKLYESRGFDILTVKTTAYDTLFPKNGSHQIARNLLRFLEQSDYDHILVHALSVGTYQFGEILVQLTKSPGNLRDLQSRIKGCIFDSSFRAEPRDVNAAAIDYGHHVAQNLVKNASYITIPNALAKFWDVYLSVMSQRRTQHLMKAHKALLANPLQCPTLFLYSKIDPVSPDYINERYIEQYKKSGKIVWAKRWDDTVHVRSFAQHPQKYIQLLDQFISQLDLNADY